MKITFEFLFLIYMKNTLLWNDNVISKCLIRIYSEVNIHEICKMSHNNQTPCINTYNLQNELKTFQNFFLFNSGIYKINFNFYYGYSLCSKFDFFL